MAVAKGYKKNPSLTICFICLMEYSKWFTNMLRKLKSVFPRWWSYLCHQPCSTHWFFTSCKSPQSPKKTLVIFGICHTLNKFGEQNEKLHFQIANLWCQWKFHLKMFLTHHIFQQLLPLLLWTRGTMALRFSLDSSVRKSVAANKSFSNLAISSCTNQGLQLVAKKSEKRWDDQGF